MKQGKLIVFEGIDGCGKTTALDNVGNEWILDRNQTESAISCKLPTDGTYGKQIRQQLQNDSLDFWQEFNLFLKDMLENERDVVIPYIERGYQVLCDRSYISSMVYQNNDRLSYMQIMAECEKVLTTPDLVIFLQIDPMIAYQRLEQSGKVRDKNETMSKINKHYHLYNKIMIEEKLFNNICVIDAQQSKHKMAREIYENIQQFINRKI